MPLLCMNFPQPLPMVSGACLWLWCEGFWLQWLLLRSTASRCMGFSSCSSCAPEHRLLSCGTLMGLISPWYVRSSWTRDQTSVPCIAKQILNHWATKECGGFNSSLFFLTHHSSTLLLLYRIKYTTVLTPHLPLY